MGHWVINVTFAGSESYFCAWQVPETQFPDDPPAEEPPAKRGRTTRSSQPVTPGVQSPFTFIDHTHKRDVCSVVIQM